MTSDDRGLIDRAIDDTARAMTAGEPDASFRARVVARLEGRRPARVSAWQWSPIAVAALLVVAAFLMRATRPPVQPEIPRLAGRAETVVVPMPGRTAVAATPTSTRTREVRVPVNSDVAALAPPPLDVATLTVTEMGREPIEIPELETIAPIAIAPIGDPEGERR